MASAGGASGGPLPRGSGEAVEIGGRAGGATVRGRDAPATLWIVARGHVGPTSIREILARAGAFGEAHPDGWDYVVDVGAVRLPNPLNGWWLRRIHRLPHLRRYVVVCPSPVLRRLMAATAPLGGPDLVVARLEDVGQP